jgi:hypothetical protein
MEIDTQSGREVRLRTGTWYAANVIDERIGENVTSQLMCRWLRM